jgi:hypothetical protein
MNGSPRFKLFWSDALPVLKEALDKCVAFVVVTVIAVLSSEEFLKIVESHFGKLVAVTLASVVGYVATKRAVKDNTKGG